MKSKDLTPLLVLYTALVITTPLAVPDPDPVRVKIRAVTMSTLLRRWRSSSFGFKCMGSKESLAILNAEAISVISDMFVLQVVLALRAVSAGACLWCQCYRFSQLY